MAKATKCVYCGQRKPKRACPALDGMICSRCCGQHRIVDIDCPDCTYLDNENYQTERRQNRELAEAVQSVNPNVLGADVFTASDAAAEFAHALEMYFGRNYVKSDLEDRDVKEALKAAYFQIYREEDFTPRGVFALALIDFLQDRLIPEFDSNLSRRLQEMIILRLILSIRMMSGGKMGNCGYLNYVKNNILYQDPKGRVVMEFATGQKKFMDQER